MRIEDLQLLNIVKDFLIRNLSKDYVDNVYLYSPAADAKDPLIVVNVLSAGEERDETDGGNEGTTQVEINVLTTNYDYGTPELQKSIERLYVSVAEVRRVIETEDYLDYVREKLEEAETGLGATVRIDDISRTYGIVPTGRGQYIRCAITTPFIIHQQKGVLTNE